MAKILVVDDQLANRQYLVKLLGYGGHTIFEAADGVEALDLTQIERPDLVISDILMPRVDGFEFVRRLRDDPAIAKTAVIFYTAIYQQEEAVALARSCGVLHVLAKPCRPEVLLGAIEEALLSSPSTTRPGSVEFKRGHQALLVDTLVAKAKELEVANLRLTALIELGCQLGQVRDPLRLLENYCHGARSIIGGQSSAVYVFSKQGNGLKHVLVSGMEPFAPMTEQGAFAELFQESRPRRLRAMVPDARTGIATPQEQAWRSLLFVPIATASRRYGALLLLNKVGMGEFSEEDERVATTLAGQMAIAYESAQQFEEIQADALRLEREVNERRRAEEQVRSSAQRLQELSRRLVAIQEEERRHLARELHDEIGQVLTAISINLKSAQAMNPAAAQKTLPDSIAIVDRAIEQVRSLSLDLRPSILDDLGLEAALQWYVGRLPVRPGFRISFTSTLSDSRLSPEIAIACFRVAQEALTNVLRHAQAHNVSIELTDPGAAIELRVSDDGVGFDVEACQRRATSGSSFGLLGMQERVMLVGGTIEFTSGPAGTTVHVRFPRPAAESSSPHEADPRTAR